MNDPYEINSWMESHPVRGAWIEIIATASLPTTGQVSHPVRGAWIEIRQEIGGIEDEQCRIP